MILSACLKVSDKSWIIQTTLERIEKKGIPPLSDTTAISKNSDNTDAVSRLASTNLDSSLRSEDDCVPHPEGIDRTSSESRREQTVPGAAAVLAPGNIWDSPLPRLMQTTRGTTGRGDARCQISADPHKGLVYSCCSVVTRVVAEATGV